MQQYVALGADTLRCKTLMAFFQIYCMIEIWFYPTTVDTEATHLATRMDL